jgi:hypothetical protein
MLFEGLPRSPEHPARERALISGIVALLGTGLYGALTVLAHQAHWTTATPEQWVAYADLNAIGHHPLHEVEHAALTISVLPSRAT